MDPATPPRSRFVAALGWTLLVTGALATPLSVVTILMLIAGADGTSTFDPLGFLAIVVAPPATAATGLGLLSRQRWAAVSAALLLVAVMAAAAWHVLAPPVPQHTTIGAGGVPTTVSASEPPNVTAALAVVALAAVALLGLVRRRDELGGRRRGAAAGWRVGHRGRDMMYYEEWRDGAWQRLEISGEMLAGRAHHAIYFDAPQRWNAYPAWARHRRDEIIARITSELRPPDYVYVDAAADTAMPLRSIRRPTPAATPRQDAAVLRIAAALLLALAGALLWLAGSSLVDGETVFPSTLPSLRRAVLLDHEPLMFSVSVALYAAAGVAALGLAVWLLRVGRRAPHGGAPTS